jgi:hypothetical protein
MWFPATEVHHHAAEPNGTIWAVVVCGSHDTADGPEFHCDMAVLGTVLDDMREWRPLVDTILLLKRPAIASSRRRRRRPKPNVPN